ncbi:MAG: type IV toxin-antitoxin system AbiEi family antitoxin [Nitrospira sp.]
MKQALPERDRPIPSKLPAVFRPKDLAECGVSVDQLQTWLRRGDAERIGRGLYRQRDAELTEQDTVVKVCARAPRAIVCLLTALHLHGIGTQLPRQVWIALDRKARKPKLEGLPTRIVRFSGPMLTYAIETRTIQGVQVRVTTPARTIIDCFRYRKRIGLDVALEALRDGLRSKQVTVDKLRRAAEVCRIQTVIRPYLESMAS